jgi:general secretion pathway protein L
VKFGEFTQRLGRADFLDGVGIYIGPHEMALASVSKRFLQVSLKDAATYPLPPADQPTERRAAVAAAVAAFVREHQVDTRRAFLALSRSEAAFSRALLPAAARENLAQVLEYEIENLVPFEREQIYYDYSSRDRGEERIEVLLMCIPRETVRVHLEALEDALVRPRGIVLASTAIADFLAFCRGDAAGPLGLVIALPDATEVAFLNGGQLVQSQLVPRGRRDVPGVLAQSVERQLIDERLDPDAVPLYRWELGNGAGPGTAQLGDGNLPDLARGRLEAPLAFFDGVEPAVLPALGAALDAVREGTLRINLLPEEGRRGSDDGMSLTTILLVGLTALLAVVAGVSVLVKDTLLHRQVQAQVAAVQPEVAEVKKLQNEVADLQRQLDILNDGQGARVTSLLKELTELIPPTAYLTTVSMRGRRVTIDGQADMASDLIAALDKSKTFRNVTFSSPTTKAGDKERFSIVAELAR